MNKKTKVIKKTLMISVPMLTLCTISIITSCKKPKPTPPTPTFFSRLVDLTVGQEITDMYLLMPREGWNGDGDSGQGVKQTIMSFRNDDGSEAKRFVFEPASRVFGWDHFLVLPIVRYDEGESQMFWDSVNFGNLITNTYTYNQQSYYYLQFDRDKFNSGGVVIDSIDSTIFASDQNFSEWLNACYVISDLV